MGRLLSGHILICRHLEMPVLFFSVSGLVALLELKNTLAAIIATVGGCRRLSMQRARSSGSVAASAGGTN